MSTERIAEIRARWPKDPHFKWEYEVDIEYLLDALTTAQQRIAELEGDRERIDYLEEHQKPTMVDGRPEGLAAVIVHHIEISLRDAIDAARKAEAGEVKDAKK